MKIIDKVDLPEVAKFVEKQLAPFDLSKLDWFKLLPLPKKRWRHQFRFFDDYEWNEELVEDATKAARS